MMWRSMLLVLIFVLPAAALTPATLVDDQLESQRITVTTLRDEVLTYFDEDRRLRSEPVTEFVQLRQIGDAPANATTQQSVLVLIDGQQLAGQWAGAGTGGESVVWAHPELGEVTAPLERVQSIGVVDSVVVGAALAEDQVVLANGDVLNGFIDGFTEGGLHLSLAGAAETVELPRDRIKAVRLANPVEAEQPRLHTVVLDDGSRLHVADPQIAGETFVGRVALLGPEPVTLPVARVARLEFSAGGTRLVALTDLPWTLESGGEVFGLPWRPRTDRNDLLLHAPVAVRFELPANAERLAAVATLDSDEAQAWADFELVLSSGEGEPHRYHISAEQPKVRVNVALADDVLRVELVPGANGPILDRLRLREAVLLVRSRVSSEE